MRTLILYTNELPKLIRGPITISDIRKEKDATHAFEISDDIGGNIYALQIRDNELRKIPVRE